MSLGYTIYLQGKIGSNVAKTRLFKKKVILVTTYNHVATRKASLDLVLSLTNSHLSKAIDGQIAIVNAVTIENNHKRSWNDYLGQRDTVNSISIPC